MTTTISEVRGMLERYVKACEALDLIPDGYRVIMDEGSKTYGRAYRVALQGAPVKRADGTNDWPNGSGHGRPPAGGDFLGMTKSEAYHSLHLMAAALEDVAHAQKMAAVR